MADYFEFHSWAQVKEALKQLRCKNADLLMKNKMLENSHLKRKLQEKLECEEFINKKYSGTYYLHHTTTDFVGLCETCGEHFGNEEKERTSLKMCSSTVMQEKGMEVDQVDRDVPDDDPVPERQFGHVPFPGCHYPGPKKVTIFLNCPRIPLSSSKSQKKS